MSRTPKNTQSERIAKILFDAIQCEVEASGLSARSFMASVNIGIATYTSLRVGHVPSGLTILRLFFELDIDQSVLGELIDLAGEFNEQCSNTPLKNKRHDISISSPA